ncbi:MAG: helix-turn-helix transcriptional regulator [Clostridia bacterium]|nr:helix-turn-helix transcriptional regulator [Clostridia bacterium]
MKYSQFIEKEPHGTSDFPIEFYRLDRHHLRYEMSLHWHPEMELIRVYDGRFELHLNKQSYTLTAGDVAIVNPGTLHRGEPTDCRYDCSVFKTDMLCPSGSTVSRYIKPIAGQTHAVREYLPSGSAPEVLGCVDRLFSTLADRPPQYELSVYAALYELFFTLHRCGLVGKNDSNHVRDKQLTHLTRLLEWIDENYTQKITLASLSKISGLNEKYLCRFFKEYTSHTPIDYINRLRVEKAADDMLSRHFSVTEAAFANGFNDSAYFSKIFRQIKGVSPSEFRKGV